MPSEQLLKRPKPSVYRFEEILNEIKARDSVIEALLQEFEQTAKLLGAKYSNNKE